MSNDEKVADDSVDQESQTASEINLNSNIEARIKNPLAGIPRAQLLRNVEVFAQEKGLTEELPILSKGAVRKSRIVSTDVTCAHATTAVAQSPADFETLDVLDESDRDIIRYEYAHRWSHPFTLYMTIVLCSVGAATQLVFAHISTMSLAPDTFKKRMGSDRIKRGQ